MEVKKFEYTVHMENNHNETDYAFGFTKGEVLSEIYDKYDRVFYCEYWVEIKEATCFSRKDIYIMKCIQDALKKEEQ